MENRKILVIELDKDSESEMIKSFAEQKDVLLKGKVIEMHRNMQSYERHLREEYSNKISE